MKAADIIIIGSGIACTSTLIEVFNRLNKHPVKHKLFITVIEKSDEFWLGIPYGSRSSVNALTITSIYDFFTDERERLLFLNWFNQNKTQLFACYLHNGGDIAKKWIDRNEQAICAEDWKQVYLPRYIFGKYHRQRLDTILDVVTTKGLVDLNLVNAEATDIRPTHNGYEVCYELADKTIFTMCAGKVVIATGSAPLKKIDLAAEINQITVINDVYEPGANANIKKIESALANTKNITERNILIIGSNASSIELLYLLAGLPNINTLVNRLVVISNSGLLPYHIIERPQDHYPTPSLDIVKKEGGYDIETLICAAKKDITASVKEGVVVPHINKIIGFTLELMQPLDEEAKKAFLGIYGMQLSNLFRRSGADYKYGEGLLHEMEKLTMLKGRLDKIECVNGCGELHYTTPDTDKKHIYSEKFKVVINCTGSHQLSQSPSMLIYNLVHKGIAKVNLSGKGFFVNERFEAAPNLYVIGPLLGGNKNNRIHFWHLENASRIMYLAPYLAECLVC